MIAFGPVPSRRLGRSLGINNIPPKVCSNSCAYCQVGRTSEMQVKRRPFYQPEEIWQQVEEKVKRSRELGLAMDYFIVVSGSVIIFYNKIRLRFTLVTAASQSFL